MFIILTNQIINDMKMQLILDEQEIKLHQENSPLRAHMIEQAESLSSQIDKLEADLKKWEEIVKGIEELQEKLRIHHEDLLWKWEEVMPDETSESKANQERIEQSLKMWQMARQLNEKLSSWSS